MRRTCSQSIKILFPTRVFYGTEVTVPIQKSGHMIKNVRVIIDIDSQNVLEERIIERIDLLCNEHTLEKLEGEYIHVRNNFFTPIEKKEKLSELLCKSNSGQCVIHIPFESTNRGLFLLDNDFSLRILFNSSLNKEIFGYLLIDYYLVDSFPNVPYIQNTKQVQKFSRSVNSPKNLRMNIRTCGSVSEIYITVKDTLNNTYIDGITNASLNFGSNQRFNLSGMYMRYVEPLKRIGVFPTEPMYMYSFSISPKNEYPNGSTYFKENSVIDLDFYDNTSTYEVTLWVVSHSFIYVNKNITKNMFDSEEMLIDTSVVTSDQIVPVPLRISYINFAGSVSISYSSEYEISNVQVNTNANSYSISQNTIYLNKIDSVYSEYYANIVFSSKGFSDTTCYLDITGNRTYDERITYNSEGYYPILIDNSQKFHYVYSNIFNFNYNIFTSNINQILIDENKNYSLTTYTSTASNILGTSTLFTGPGSIVATYDQNMNLVYTQTFSGSNVTIGNSNTYGIYKNNTGLITCRDYGYSNYMNAGYSNVFIDEIASNSTVTYASVRFSNSTSNVSVSGLISSSLGTGTNRASLLRITKGNPDSLFMVSNCSSFTSLKFSKLFNPIWAFKFSNTSSTSFGVNFSQTKGGYYVYSPNWNVTVNNVLSSSIQSQLLTDKTLDNTFFIGGYNSTTPELSGFFFKTGTGFFVLKIDKNGYVRYALSVLGQIENTRMLFDECTGMFMLNVTTIPSTYLDIYNNGSSIYSDLNKYQFFIFDDYGNINSYIQNLDYIFSIPKTKYYTPIQTSQYFAKPIEPVSEYSYWTGAFSGTKDSEVFAFTVDTDTDDIYIMSGMIPACTSNVYDKYGNTNKPISFFGSSLNGIITKVSSNCSYYGWFLRVTNLADENYIGSSLLTTPDYLYLVTTTNNSSSTRVYNKSNVEVVTLSSLSSNNLLLIRFYKDGTYANWYMNIHSSSGNRLKSDSSGNIYVTGRKQTTASQNVFVNGNSVGSIPATTINHTSFVMKLNSSGTILWTSYVDGGSISRGITDVAIDSNFNVYLGGQKPATAAYIYGTNTITPAVIPATSNISSAYVVKFNSNGSYGSWFFTLIGLDFKETSEITSINCLTNNDLGVTLLIGGYNNQPVNGSSNIFVNTSNVATLQKINASNAGFFLKFNSSGTYQWKVTMGGNGVFSNFVNDKYDNIIISGGKQGGTYNIVDSGNRQGGRLPSTYNDAGFLIRINSDGTYSNMYGIMDSFRYDGAVICAHTKNYDIVLSGNAYRYPTVSDKDLYLYDKNGYVTLINVDTNITYYVYWAKYNSNFTLNKISL